MESINEFINRYESAITMQKWDELSDFFHDNCAVLYTDGTYVGKNMLKLAFDKTDALMKNGKYNLTEIHYPIINKKFCTIVGIFKWSSEIYGTPINSENRITLCIVNDKGYWKIVNQHLGPMPK